MRHVRSVSVLATVAALTSSSAAQAQEAGGQAPALAQDSAVQAIWKRQEIDFFYQSFTTFYTCDGIEDRVEEILKAVGAKDVKAIATGCMGSAPSRTPHVHIVAKTPIEATPEALAELQKTQTQRELKARVRKERPEDALAQFPATWKRVDLSVGKLGIEEGECELIEELSRKVFPKIGIRTVKDDTNCVPHQRNIGQPRLQVDALTAVPSPDEKA